MIERQTAKKAKIWDVMNGSFVKKEGLEPSFVRTKEGEEISRARLLGTVVSKFLADDGNYASVTIDDGTDTIRLKVFKTTKPLDSLKPGDIIDVVGKIREYEGETYVIPEVARKVENPNFELLRRLELVYKARGMKKAKDMIGKSEGKKPEDLSKELLAKGLKKEWIEPFLKGDRTEEGKEKKLLKNDILKIIEDSKDGIVYSELMKKIGAEEAEIESAIDELLNDGICYEPSPGKIRKI